MKEGCDSWIDKKNCPHRSKPVLFLNLWAKINVSAKQTNTWKFKKSTIATIPVWTRLFSHLVGVVFQDIQGFVVSHHNETAVHQFGQVTHVYLGLTFLNEDKLFVDQNFMCHLYYLYFSLVSIFKRSWETGMDLRQHNQKFWIIFVSF